MAHLLVVDDDVDTCNLLTKFLVKKGFKVDSAFNGKTALELIKQQTFDVMLCDYRLGDMDGPEVMQRAHELQPNLKVIIITGYSDVKLAVQIIKAGSFDYITKPLLPEEILIVINDAVNSKTLRKQTSAEDEEEEPVKKSTSSALQTAEHFVGKSAASRELYKQVSLVAPTNYSVIINGESGSGKESVALRIHELSSRKNEPFVAMDCGAISKELAGSELFGHEKGSFTGAQFQKIGHFELANGGTLFLDEVVNLNYETQASLLRVVQERKLKRIGGTKEIGLDVRIVIATNENLAEAVRKGKFREDLYHRFNEFIIQVPPVREREKDILDFAKFFLEKANKELDKSIISFSAEAEESFLTYPWPGNLRELKNVVKRAALLTTGNYIETKSLPLEISKNDVYNFSQAKNNNGVESHESSELPAKKRPALKNAALNAEQEMILKALQECKYNKSKVAKMLNVDRKTLYNKMKTLNIKG
jgi:two-component system, NtrC family, response regulator HydG